MAITHSTVHHFLENSAKLHGDKVAVVCGEKRLTYREINEAAEKFARYLISIGIGRQDRVVIFLENSVESVVALFGILKAGGVFIMLNATMKAGKLAYILNNSGARALVAHEAGKKTVSDAVAKAPELQHLVWCQAKQSQGIATPDAIGVSSSVYWSEAQDRTAVGHEVKLPSIIDVDLATIIYTSGSTGEPKGVVSAHYNVVAAAHSITTYLGNVESDIVMNTLPLSFDYGLYQLLMTFLFGGTLVLEKSFTYPQLILERLVAERVTGFPIVPTMVAIMLQMESIGRFDFTQLRYLTNTGAALPVAYIHKLQELLPHVMIFSMYGLTECKRVSYLPPKYLAERPDSVGIPIPNSEVYVVDTNGKEVGPHEVGELVVRGSHVMQGYWNDPEETAQTFKVGKYRGEAMLHTGDLFRRDEEGFLYFVARMDDLIKTKGERVSPKEIENALCALEGVAEAAVIGVPDEILGKAIKAFIVADKKQQLNKKQVQAFCRKTLEPFMVPKYVQFVERLPKSNSGKIDKKELMNRPQLKHS